LITTQAQNKQNYNNPEFIYAQRVKVVSNLNIFSLAEKSEPYSKYHCHSKITKFISSMKVIKFHQQWLT